GGFHAVFKQAALHSFMYIGGNKQDRLLAVTCNDVDQTYFAGSTTSTEDIATTGAKQEEHANNGSWYDGLMGRLDDDRPLNFIIYSPPASPPSTFSNFCPGGDYSGQFCAAFEFSFKDILQASN